MAMLKTTQATQAPDTQAADPERRHFLRLLGMGGGAVALGQVPFTQAATHAPSAATGQKPSAQATRYRETEHIRAFYATLD